MGGGQAGQERWQAVEAVQGTGIVCKTCNLITVCAPLCVRCVLLPQVSGQLISGAVQSSDVVILDTGRCPFNLQVTTRMHVSLPFPLHASLCACISMGGVIGNRAK